MLAREEVIDLIKSTKIPEKGSEIMFNRSHINNSYLLKDTDDDKIKYKLDLTQSNQVSLKLSCHHRNDTDFGLIRVDYNGPRHLNPQTVSSSVPEILHPYAGIEIEARESHVHIYVEGKGLKWAMPLDDFSKLSDSERSGISISKLNIHSPAEKNNAVRSFINTINLKANTSFTGGLILN